MLSGLGRSYKDNRRGLRAPFAGKTVLRERGRAIPCVGENISETGILLRTRAGMPNPRPRGLELILALGGRAFGLRVELARVDDCEEGRLWGLRFVGPPPAERAALRDYVREHRLQDSSISRRLTPLATKRPRRMTGPLPPAPRLVSRPPTRPVGRMATERSQRSIPAICAKSTTTALLPQPTPAIPQRLRGVLRRDCRRGDGTSGGG